MLALDRAAFGGLEPEPVSTEWWCLECGRRGDDLDVNCKTCMARYEALEVEVARRREETAAAAAAARGNAKAALSKGSGVRRTGGMGGSGDGAPGYHSVFEARIEDFDMVPMAVGICMPEHRGMPVYLIGFLGGIEHSRMPPCPLVLPPFGVNAERWEKIVMRVEAACDWYRGRLWGSRAQLLQVVRQRCFGLFSARLCGFPLRTVAEAFIVLHRIKRQPDCVDYSETGSRKAHHIACRALRKGLCWYFVSQVGIGDKTGYAQLVNETFQDFMEDRGFMDEDVDLTIYSQFMNAFKKQFGGLPGAFESHTAKVALRRGRTRNRRRVRGGHEGERRVPAGESVAAQACDSGWDEPDESALAFKGPREQASSSGFPTGGVLWEGGASGVESGDAQGCDSGWDVTLLASDAETVVLGHGEWGRGIWSGPAILPPVDEIACLPPPAIGGGFPTGGVLWEGRGPVVESGDAQGCDSGWDVNWLASDRGTGVFGDGQWGHSIWSGLALLPPVDQIALSPPPATGGGLPEDMFLLNGCLGDLSCLSSLIERS